jgi:hypothetical protein
MENVKKFYEALLKDTAMQERAKKLKDQKPANSAIPSIVPTIRLIVVG